MSTPVTAGTTMQVPPAAISLPRALPDRDGRRSTAKDAATPRSPPGGKRRRLARSRDGARPPSAGRQPTARSPWPRVSGAETAALACAARPTGSPGIRRPAPGTPSPTVTDPTAAEVELEAVAGPPPSSAPVAAERPAARPPPPTRHAAQESQFPRRGPDAAAEEMAAQLAAAQAHAVQAEAARRRRRSRPRRHHRARPPGGPPRRSPPRRPTGTPRSMAGPQADAEQRVAAAEAEP